MQVASAVMLLKTKLAVAVAAQADLMGLEAQVAERWEEAEEPMEEPPAADPTVGSV